MKLKSTLLVIIGLLLISSHTGQAQVKNLSELTVKEIMSKDYIGHSPERTQWSADSKRIFFNWNPENKKSASPYQLNINQLMPEPVERSEMQKALPVRKNLNQDKSKELISRGGDLTIVNVKKGDTLTVYSTTQRISSAQFTLSGRKVTFLIDRTVNQFSGE